MTNKWRPITFLVFCLLLGNFTFADEAKEAAMLVDSLLEEVNGKVNPPISCEVIVDDEPFARNPPKTRAIANATRPKGLPENENNNKEMISLGEDHKLSTFQMASQDNYDDCMILKEESVFDDKGNELAQVCPEFLKQLEIHGIGKLKNGKVIQFHKSVKDDDGNWKSIFFIAKKSCPNGVSGAGHCLDPYRSIVVDKSKGLKPGDIVYIDDFRSQIIPPGINHGGYLVVSGVADFPNDDEFKVFIGEDTHEKNAFLEVGNIYGRKFSLTNVVGKEKEVAKRYMAEKREASHRIKTVDNNISFQEDDIPAGQPVFTSGLKTTDDENAAILASIDALKEEKTKLTTAKWKPEYTDYIMEEISGNSILLSPHLSDVKMFCPRFASMTANEKKLFWAYYLKAVSFAETEHNPQVGYIEKKQTKGDYHLNRVVKRHVPKTSDGLLQLSHQDIERHGCDFPMIIDERSGRNDYKLAALIADKRKAARDYADRSSSRLSRSDRWKLRSASLDFLVEKGFLSAPLALKAKSQLSIYSPEYNLKCGVKVLANQLSERKTLEPNPDSYYWSTLNSRNKDAYAKYRGELDKAKEFCSPAYVVPELASVDPESEILTYNSVQVDNDNQGFLGGQYKLNLVPAEAGEMAHQIGLFEFNNQGDDIVQWNNGEDFLSLGLGHFTWFPKGKTNGGVESFPKLIEFLVNEKGYDPRTIPSIIRPERINGRYQLNKDLPFSSKAQFESERRDPDFRALHSFMLRDDIKEMQFEFIKDRLEQNMDSVVNFHNSPSYDGPKVENKPELTNKMKRYVDQLSKSAQGRYAMIDYVNFKGEGTNTDERVRVNGEKTSVGYGLYQVLAGAAQEYDGTQEPEELFSKYSTLALNNRINVGDPTPDDNSGLSRYKRGWNRRTAFYGDKNSGVAALDKEKPERILVAGPQSKEGPLPTTIETSLASTQPFENQARLVWRGNYPKVDCKKWGLNGSNFCFPEPGKIILSPGHSDDSSSRNSENDGHGGYFFHEGRMNMATSLIVKDAIDSCLAKKDENGKVRPEVRMTRWPGDNYFGEQEFEGKKAGKIQEVSPRGGRKDYVTKYLTGENGVRKPNVEKNSLFLSMHYNAGLSGNPGRDYPSVFVDPSDPGRHTVSKSIALSLAEETKAFLDSLGANSPVSNSQKVYEHGIAQFTSDATPQYARTEGTSGMGMLRTSFNGMKHSLIEGFFMDGAIGERVAAKIRSNDPRNYFEFNMKKQVYDSATDRWVEGQSIKPIYRLTKEHLVVANAVVKGIMNSPEYQCKK